MSVYGSPVSVNLRKPNLEQDNPKAGDYVYGKDGYAKTEDIPTKPEDIGAQPAGNYLTEVPTGYATEQWVEGKIHAIAGDTETVLSDNLLDLSLLTRGKCFYYGSSGFSLVDSADGYYGFIPLRGPGTYRTKFQASVHSSTAKRIALVDDNNVWVANVTGSHGDIPSDDTRNWLDFEFVVTQAHIDAGATKVAFDAWVLYLDKTMIVKDREYPDKYIPYGYIEVSTDSGKKQDNVLNEKTAVFLGDSLCAGTTVGADSPYYGYGWGGIIGEANRMTWKNYGKNGGTITHRGSDNTCIAKIADTAIAEYPTADYVIFEGGCNDADQMKEAGLGEISADYATFDTSTFSGALEALILKLITAYPYAKIGYIIPQKMYTGYADYTADKHIHRLYLDRAAEICRKWGIPYVDIWNGSPLNPKLSTASIFYVEQNGQHLTEAGYLAITPMIESWMRDMSVTGGAGNGNVDLTGYATEEWVQQGYQPKGNYLTEHQDVTGKADTVYVDEQIADVKAEIVQQAPLFANSIEECTDTSKLYVLPDGYIYAYLYTEAVYDCKNWIPYSVDTDDSIYNGIGYKVGCRINSSGALKEGETKYALTGFIPFVFGEIVYLSADIFKDDPGSCVISPFNGSKQFLSNASVYVNNTAVSTDSNGNYVFDPRLMESGSSIWAGAEFIRVTGVASMSSNSIVTVDEEIGSNPDNNTGGGGGYAWVSTGHAFVPADYEERIIALEEKATEQSAKNADYEERISAVEKYDISGLPDYAITERDSVRDTLYEKLTLGNVAIIGFSTDQHISKWENMEGTVNTQGTLVGLRVLRSLTHKIPFNAVVLGGDYVTGGSVQSIQTETMMVFEQLAGAECPVVGTTGNHDSWQNDNTVTDGDIFKSHTASAVMKYHRFVNLDTISANGYIDDPTVSLRYIILDAEPRNAGSTNLKTTITANLTAMLESMPNGYKAVIFSHKPLNDSLGDNFKDEVDNKTVLEANASKIVCCINGHGHLDASATSNGVLYIQTTCAGIDRPNDAYDRTVGTANETVFDVFVIDQTNRKIYAVRYGAGEDREFSY